MVSVIMGDFLGKYAIGSGAAWNPGTDYNNETHKKNMIESVKAMVMNLRMSLIFCLALGNENVYGYAATPMNSRRHFLNSLMKWPR